MKKKNALSDEQVALFRETVESYSTLLNMRDWRISVSDKPASKGCMADCSTSLEDKVCTIRIGADWGPQEVTNQMVSETAIHELLHAFLSPVLAAAQARDMATMQSAEHSVITVLERLLT